MRDGPQNACGEAGDQDNALKLAVRRKPYFVVIAPGIGLGYRRSAGVGTWSVRASDGRGSNWLKSFAIADDFEESNAGGNIMTFWEASGPLLTRFGHSVAVSEADCLPPLTRHSIAK